MIGNDPDMVRFLVAMAAEVNPMATVTEEGHQGGQTVEAEIATIEKRMREDRRGYNRDEPMQARYRELMARLPSLKVFGGCCGTDIRHVTAVRDALIG